LAGGFLPDRQALIAAREQTTAMVAAMSDRILMIPRDV
jgi:hypothetical protein